jgi:hypothetical protein
VSIIDRKAESGQVYMRLSDNPVLLHRDSLPSRTIYSILFDAGHLILGKAVWSDSDVAVDEHTRQIHEVVKDVTWSMNQTSEEQEELET